MAHAFPAVAAQAGRAGTMKGAYNGTAPNPMRQKEFGKVLGKVVVSAEAERPDIEKAALADPNVRRYVEEKTVRMVIVVPGRLVNVVVS